MAEEQKIINLQESLKKFVDHLRELKRSENTVLAYETDLKQLVELLEKRGVNHPTAVNLEELNQIKDHYFKQGYTNKSVSRKLNSYRAFFTFLVDQKIIDKDPSAGIEYPKTELGAPRILSKMEYRALRDACRTDPRISAIVEILLQTGIRISELANLRLADIKEDSLSIRPQYSQPGRTVPLNKVAQQALDRYLAKRPKGKVDNVFITSRGKAFLIRNIRESIKRFSEAAGVKDASVNDLRHTFIAHHLEAGTPLPTVAKLVGHKRVSTTERYLQYVQPAKEVEKLEEL